MGRSNSAIAQNMRKVRQFDAQTAKRRESGFMQTALVYHEAVLDCVRMPVVGDAPQICSGRECNPKTAVRLDLYFDDTPDREIIKIKSRRFVRADGVWYQLR